MAQIPALSRLQEHPLAIPSLIVLTLAIAVILNLNGLFHGVSVVLPHLFYIPIILAAFFYPKKGILFAIVLSAAYLTMVIAILPDNTIDIVSAAARAIVYVFIAAVVSYLSERLNTREQGVIRANDEWENTFNAIPDLIALIGKDHRILRVNKAMADSLGISPENAVGVRCYEVVHNSSTYPGNCPHAQLLKDGLEHTSEVHEDVLGGDFLVTTSPLYDATGTLIGSVHVARDITERKRIEKALRESEVHYRTIIDNLQDVYFRTDTDGRILMVSPSATSMFGYDTPDEMVGQSILAFWKNHEARPQMIRYMQDHGSEVKGWEAEFIKKDGTTFWVSINGRLRTDDEGRVLGTEGIWRDISESKKYEEALKSALKKLNTLSSITRHDILNQITGLRTYLELSREDLKGTKYAELVEKEDRAAEAIQRQIEFTKYYQDIGVNAPRWQNVEAVIREAAAQLTLPVNLQVSIGKIEVFADPLIVKVFFNLMENSLRHGERVTTMSFSSCITDAGLVIVYSDNGVGISEADKQKLFRKGFGKHTGLGLFLSREILAITNIGIMENGVPGEGVRFEIVVPCEGYRLVP